ncbi:hypothetical protein HMPREF0731_1795 [Pseudoroseomonas cervicalis ATCC 49957]|uniref:Uncharacterized protein n=2 Tax=Teichococcus cervicalis TaxID=204525 RepID=D5RL34_9PROT|nr:hypothetical protein HMPREF0731_1795 [Pseudoroseomonas cervicalis ATCC 49957]
MFEGAEGFFFEKKNQKTSVSLAFRRDGRRRQPEKSLLLLFFRKEDLPEKAPFSWHR